MQGHDKTSITGSGQTAFMYASVFLLKSSEMNAAMRNSVGSIEERSSLFRI